MATLNKSDLTFLLTQIKIAEARANGNVLSDLPDAFAPFGLRTVDGSYNNLIPGQSEFGAADNNFRFLLHQSFRNEGDDTFFGGPFNNDYAKLNLAGTHTVSVVDADPRIISNLIVDQTWDPLTGEGNPVVGIAAQNNPFAELVTSPGLDGIFNTPDDVQVWEIPNITPDVGLTAPFNSWFTFFGQFFDHGLDLVNKGGDGTVFIPLQPDDPLFDPTPGAANFMAVTRASNITITAGVDGLLGTSDDVHTHNNQTTPFIDQNQTYTSHPSHQVFLREYVLVGGKPVATGNLLDGAGGGLPTWAEIKAQAQNILGVVLDDMDVLNLPLVATDAYGKFIPHPVTGLVQLVTSAAGALQSAASLAVPIDGSLAQRTNHAFMDDIAHHAAPGFVDHDNNPATPAILKVADSDAGPEGLFGDDNNPLTYDNEMLNAHFITGDGRGNENIGLTTVHYIFHAEHNRQVADIQTNLVADAVATNNVTFLNEWLNTDLANVAAIPANLSTLNWDGERLFQAARFATEMQYQHLVFEEFARTIQPNIDPFLAPIGYDVTINPAILAEFAHVVYRFGHSMLTETVDRFDPNFNVIDADPLHPAQDASGHQIGLIAAFLNPLAFVASDQAGVAGNSAAEAAGAIIRGMTRQVGNEIDEFVTEALRNNLVGLPLDLAAINMARARDAGVPSLNAARREFFHLTQDAQLAAYTSWVDFAGHLKHEESVINFIAAYGTHSTITSALTSVDKRAAAFAIVTGVGFVGSETDRLDFLNSNGVYTNLTNGVTTTGVDVIDLWIGGLAEKQQPFGGLLGSTFNFVFETQLEDLQNGDRFYYLSRTAGQHFGAELENNSFAKLIMLNTDATHLPANVFLTPEFILEVNQSSQFTGIGVDGRADPLGGSILVPLVIRDNPATPGLDSNYLRFTGGETVVLGGSAGNDFLIAGDSDDDTVYGDGGNDTLHGGGGDDNVFGGAGDDIIFGDFGNDVLRGEAGNDVLAGGSNGVLGGNEILFGGEGSDFIVTGEDIAVTFAGEGNDFVLGAKNNLETIGGEGNDWLEYGHQEGTVGDNFDAFGRDLVAGHDVIITGSGFDDIIAEGGDDIIVMSDGQEKVDGASGFDWASYISSPSGVTADMRTSSFRAAPATPSTFGLLDLFSFVEGLSGTRFADVLRGDDSLATDIPFAGAQGSVLDAAGIARIVGLQAVVGAGVTSFSGGNIILGGDGSDIIEGRYGDDIIDGDRWLNARISVRDPLNHATEMFSVDSMSDIMVRVLAGEINPGQLEIVREILTASGPAYDTAMYSGIRANYTVLTAGDGTTTVRDNFGTLRGTDGTDVLRNIERIQFADQALDLPGGPANAGPTGQLAISDTTPALNQLLTVSIGNVADANIAGGSIAGRPVSYYWQVERPGVNGAAGNYWEDIITLNGLGGAPTTADGVTLTVPVLTGGLPIEGSRLRVRAVYQDDNGVLENVFSNPTAAVGPAGPASGAAAALPTESAVTSAGVHLIRSDLQFILDQIIIAERHAGGADLLTMVGNERMPLGLRTVDGSFNNLVQGQSEFGAADNNFPLLLDQQFRNEGDDAFGPVTNNNYASTISVVDADPRIISNLIADQTANNPAAVAANGGNAAVMSPGLDGIFGTADDRAVFQIDNVTPDAGLTAPFNSWMTLFGQFFDHGLDLVDKGGAGTVYIPLLPGDPLYIVGSPTNFMAVTRATNMAVNAGVDGILGTKDDVHLHNNETTPFIDQNQTYTSHASHQVFLREYAMVNHDGIAATPVRPVATGRLLDGANGIGNWAEVKAQAAQKLGIQLTDADIFDAPLLATDQYGKFIPGLNGFAQFVTTTGLVEANPAANAGQGTLVPANGLRSGHAFLNDIAHAAVPVIVGGVLQNDGDAITGNAVPVGPLGNNLQYDDELLDAHFITGDGRGNENIGLTTVHFVFHAEHNRLVEHVQDVALAANDVAFLNQWLRVDVAALPTTAAQIANLQWDGERLFQAARFATEMQYQHLVFEEFARKISPNVDLFFAASQVYETDLNPAIVAEFAHVVYRFGHSMLNETVDRFDPSFNIIDADPLHPAQDTSDDQIGLIAAFLNPLAFAASGGSGAEAAGAIIRGMTRQVGNELDEFVTEALRNNLVGLPLDLPAINIARGRETGVPSLNAARAEFYALTGDSDLVPYTSWVDFAIHLKHQESVINFIAAYGTHASITGAASTDAKRAAALAIVTGAGFGGTEAERMAFLNGAAASTGVNDIDLWIGGLAEKQNAFGGLLGTTFNFVFENQMEKLQAGDRFYYLERTAGLNFLTELEGNTFAKMIMANTDATHLPAAVFLTPAYTLEVNQALQYTGLGLDGRADPVGGTILTPLVIRDNPATVGPDSNYLRYTGAETVVLGGTAGNDTLIAGESDDDTVYGDGGNDRIDGGYGNDNLFGGTGDDIIMDLGGDDVIHGNEGHDAIQGGNGLNLIFGDLGNDFIVSGEDASEVFGGPGDDFIYGSRVNEQDMGNEGGDWLEHGNADGSPGDNFDPFGRDQVVGHDVYIGNTVTDIMNAEGGDDIMVGNGGQQDHYLGASGFDWADYKDSPNGVIVIVDLLFEAEATALGAAPSTLDRYFGVEGISGSQYGDYLIGSDHLTPFFATSGFTGSVLTNFGLIDGLAELIAPALDPLLGFSPTSFTGEILLGGAGSDYLKGGWGNEVIDGDGWLNVQIGVYDIDDVNHTGEVLGRYNSMTEIQAQIFSGEVKVSQLAAIREIRHTLLDGSLIGGVDFETFTADNDTAVFSGDLADYTVEFFDLGTEDFADDYIVVTDVQTGLDGVDILRNIERLQFADTSLVVGVAGGFNFDPINLVSITDGPPHGTTLIREDTQLTASVINPINIALSVRDGNNIVPDTVPGPGVPPGFNPLGLINSTVTYYWQTEGTGGTYVDILRDNGVTLAPVTGPTFTPGDLEVGFTLRVRAVYTDDAGFIEEVFSAPTAVVAGVNDAPVGIVAISDVSPTQNQALVALNLFTDADAPIDLIGGGVPPPIVYNYQWQRSTNINAATPTWNNIGGATTATYMPTNADTVNTGANIALRVRVTYIDGQGTAETLFSAPTSRIGINTVGDGAANNQPGTAFDDWLVGNGGNDTQTGGAGSDTLTGGTGNDSQTGGAGNDVFTYTVGDGLDTVDGGADTDTLNILGTNAGGEFLNVIYDGTGAVDRFAIPPLTSTVLNIEIVTANFLDGVDLLTYAGLGTAGNTTTVGVTVDLGAGTASGFSWIAGFENVTGGTGGDHLTGSTGANALSGGAGNDTLVGGAGNDTLDGGTGADSMVGGTGNDSYSVDNVNDLIVENAGEGIDTVLTTANVSAVGAFANVEGVTFVGAGNFTGTGDDNANAITGGAGNDTISGAGGNDTLNGAAGNDTLTGGTGNDTVNGGANNDTFIATVGDGNDSYLGDGGTDTYNLAATLAGAIITTTTSTSADTGSDTLNSVENIIGSQGADTITLGAAVNVIDGQGGNDTINAGGSIDTVSGGAGDDTFTYLIGDGADVLNGGADNDTLNITGTGGNDTLDVVYNGATFTSVEGGTVTGVEVFNANLLGGTDTLNYAGTTIAVTVNLGTPAASGFASIASVENVTGGTNADTLIGSAGVNNLNGGAGGDTLIGGGGADAINTGAANDNLTDVIRFDAATEFGDTVTNFDATGTAAQIDRVAFGGALNTLFDDGTANDIFAFVSGNGANGGNTAVNLNGTNEALFLSGANGEGVTNANLGNAGVVATEFNAEFALTAGNGESTLLVINDIDANSAAVWQWVQAGGGETAAAELTLIAILNANATVTIGDFVFV